MNKFLKHIIISDKCGNNYSTRNEILIDDMQYFETLKAHKQKLSEDPEYRSFYISLCEKRKKEREKETIIILSAFFLFFSYLCSIYWVAVAKEERKKYTRNNYIHKK